MREFISMTPQNDRTPVHCEQWRAEDEDAAWEAVKAKLVPFLEEELEMSGTDWWYVECDVELHEVHHFEDEDGDPDCEEEHLWTGTVTGYRCVHCERCDKPHLPGKDGYSDCDHYGDRCPEHMDRWIDECGCWRAKQERAFRAEDAAEEKAWTIGEIAVKRGDMTQEELDSLMEEVGGHAAVTAKLAALAKEATP